MFYDILLEHWVNPGLYERWAYEIACERGLPHTAVFEADLRYLFETSIEAGWDVYLGYGEQAANR